MARHANDKDERLADKSSNPEGPLGDVMPEDDHPDPRAAGGLPPEPVEKRPTVGRTRPEDYPENDRNKGGGAGGAGA